MHRRCLYGPINSYHSFLWSNSILCLYNVDTLNICMKEFGSENFFFDKMTAVSMVPLWADQLLPQLLMKQFDTLSIQYRHNEICMKEFIILVELRQLFPYMAFVYAWIVPLWANQLLLQLLMEQLDTLPIQCRHIEHMHEGVYNFCLHRFY